RVSVVVRVENLRLERLDALARLPRSHRVRQVHAHERGVDVLEIAHLGRALGVAGDVDALVAEREDEAFAPALLVKDLARNRAAFEVVHREGLDADARDGPALAVLHDDDSRLELFGDRRRTDEDGPRFADLLDGARV